MLHRNLTSLLTEAVSDTPVVLLNGARQTGKSTLVLQALPASFRYATLDEATVLAAVRSDPDEYVRSSERLIIDEVQRVPELFRAIKADVDQNRQPGRFVLTGSADVMVLPAISESLAGRIEILTLWPFSQGEIEGRLETFVDAVFGAKLPELAPSEPTERSIAERVFVGGYPEAIQRATARRREAWFRSYVSTIVQRDIRNLADIEGFTDLPRLLRLLAARTSALLNYAELSRSSGLPATTVRRYVALLEATFLVQMLPPWHANVGKRLVKAPKVLAVDSGLAAYLAGFNPARMQVNATRFGSLLETFVAMELRKQMTWSDLQPGLFHFRTSAGQEVDLVLEDRIGRLVGIEVKAASSVSARDMRGLKALRDLQPDRFARGLVLYGGESVVPFGPDLHAVPFRALWRW